MESIINTIIAEYPQLTFTESSLHSWSPKQQRITYYIDHSEESVWATLHEIGHATLQHTSYRTDISLLHMEVDAWRQALVLAAEHHIVITSEHIESCIDTYRDWLHKRSTCPTCDRHGIQDLTGTYTCINCAAAWQVSSDRFCRPYRLLEH
jgi:hypothetical protein